ncbi:hypothetical protein J3A83DRAFT_4368618 [Scleroderma citrinum]
MASAMVDALHSITGNGVVAWTHFFMVVKEDQSPSPLSSGTTLLGRWMSQLDTHFPPTGATTSNSSGIGGGNTNQMLDEVSPETLVMTSPKMPGEALVEVLIKILRLREEGDELLLVEKALYQEFVPQQECLPTYKIKGLRGRAPPKPKNKGKGKKKTGGAPQKKDKRKGHVMQQEEGTHIMEEFTSSTIVNPGWSSHASTSFSAATSPAISSVLADIRRKEAQDREYEQRKIKYPFAHSPNCHFTGKFPPAKSEEQYDNYDWYTKGFPYNHD